MKKVFLLMAIVVLALATVPAMAYDWTIANAGTKYSATTGYVSWAGILPATNAYAGADLVSVSHLNNYQYTAWMYCVDAVNLNYTHTYDRRVGQIPTPNLPQPTAAQWGQVAWLVKTYGVNTATMTGDQSAGLQLAIWTSVSPTSGTGAFSYTGFGGAAAYATTYLSALGSNTASYDDVVVFVDGQNLVQAPAVPEPMSIMLGIMGLGSIAGFRKLRRK